jgi:hypothetical protein
MNRSNAIIAAATILIGIVIVIVLPSFVPGCRVRVDQPPTVVFATTDVKCGKTTFTISTGTNQGDCLEEGSGGNTTGGSCSDGKNSAKVECSWNNGEGKCGSVKGSGSCGRK